jgi:hypothetical protein
LAIEIESVSGAIYQFEEIQKSPETRVIAGFFMPLCPKVFVSGINARITRYESQSRRRPSLGTSCQEDQAPFDKIHVKAR